MNWKNVIYSSVGATVGTVGVSSFLNGFDVYLLLAVGVASFSGAMLLAYISTLGKRASN